MSCVEKNRNSIWTYAALLVLVGLFLVGGGCMANAPVVEDSVTTWSEGVQVTWSFQEGRFWDSIERAQETEVANEPAHGLVVPHHELASDVIARAFKTVEDQQVQRVIVIGPNHEERGTAKVISGIVDWTVNGQRVETDRNAVGQLQRANVVTLDESVLVQEHAIGTLTPYIAHTWSDAQVVPLVVSARLDLEGALALGQELSGLLEEDMLLIASIDFSHYLPLE